MPCRIMARNIQIITSAHQISPATKSFSCPKGFLIIRMSHFNFTHTRNQLTVLTMIGASNISCPRGTLWEGDLRVYELVVAIIFFVSLHAMRHRERSGLAAWPVVGMLPSLIAGIRYNVYEWMTDVIIQQNGTFRFKGPWFSSLNCVVTSDPRNLEYLLKTRFSNFPKGKYFREVVRDLLGDGIFNADDETWRRQRKLASLEIHSAKFRRLTIDSLNELVHSRLLPVLDNVTAAVDLQDVLLRLTFDNVCMIAFGLDPGCLTPSLPETPFAKAFEDATEATLLRFITPNWLWKAMRLFNLGTEKKLKISIKAIDSFAEDVIRARKKELSLHDIGKSCQRSDLLSLFLGFRDMHGRPVSDKFLRDICINFILAGRDTSSIALTWFFWLLDQHPHVEERILREISEVLADKARHSTISMELRPDEVKKMNYLHAAISEALRLYPTVPVDHKEVLEDDTFLDGTVLRKGTKVIYAIYSMGRMEAIWGKDCREYRPERWLRDGVFVSESAYKFSAFNGGPRLCLGKEFAYYQMKFIAASIIWRYKVKVVENHPVAPKLALTMYMKHGLKVNLEGHSQSLFLENLQALPSDSP